MHIPAGPDNLTVEWLTAALREGGRASNAAVTAFEAAPIAEGKGLVGQVVRLLLEYSDDEPRGPSSLIAKFSSADDRMRRRSIGKYVQEVRFYRDLASETALLTPPCYYGAADSESGYHVLLLEDLGDSLPAARPDGCSPEQAKLAVGEIAKFHAEWWESPKLANIDWLPTPIYDQAALSRAHDDWWPEFLRKVGDTLPASMVEIGARLGPKRARLMSEIFGSSPRTLIHRDYHHDNIVFGGPAASRPFTVLDWQGMSFGRGVWDVAYFMCQSLETETRRAIETDLLQAYHRTLIDGGVTHYTFDDCLRDFRLALLQRFGSLISTIATMPFSPEQIRRHVEVLLPRNVAAVLDHDVATLLEA